MDMKNKMHIVILMGFVLCACSLRQSGAKYQDSTRDTSSIFSQESKADEPLDPEFLDLLKREEHILTPFAWSSLKGSKPVKEVIGIDEDKHLRRILYTSEGERYNIIESSLYPQGHNEYTLIETSGTLNLQDYVSNWEFPFRSNVLESEGCRVHFIQVLQALKRSLSEEYPPLTTIGLRVIIEKLGSGVISNNLEGSLSLGVKETFVKDINRDKKQDYIMIFSDMSDEIYIWTLDGCTVKHINFKEDDNILTSVGAREVFLQLDTDGTYTIHTREYEPITKHKRFYWEITEDIYRWNKKEFVFNRVDSFTWRKKT